MLLRVVLAFALVVTASSALAHQESDQKERDDHPVKPEELLALIGQADKVMVYHKARIENATLLYSSKNARVISGLKAAMAVEPVLNETRYICLCIGSPEIRLFRRQKELVRFSFFLGTFVEATIWSHRARILDEEKMLHWFDARGIHGPRRDSNERGAEAAADVANIERWMKAMPASVRELWPRIMNARPLDVGMNIFVPQGSPGPSRASTAGKSAAYVTTPEIKELNEALDKEFPDPRRRIRALFAWFGSGSGPWTGYPAYEGVVENLLHEYKKPELVAAIAGANLTEAEKEGAARFFAGWIADGWRPADNSLLSTELKRSLLAHSLKSPDKDKRARARQAFAQSN